jgi:hypothetical protein
VSCSSHTAGALAALAAMGLCGSAAAANVSKPVAPASFTSADCLTTIVRADDPAGHLEIAIPFEDVGTTPDEPPGSRHMQFFATCRDPRPGERLPTWISRADADSAAAVDPTVISPSSDDVLEESSAWSGPGHAGEGSPCVVPINAADDRIPITCEDTADGITWDTTGVPAGAYVVWGYTYEGARSVWSRRPGVVHVVDDAPETAPPAVAFSSPAARGEMRLDTGLLVQGCSAGAPGSTLELSWAALDELADDPDGAWAAFAQLEGGAFEAPFVPPADAEYAGVVFRARVTDPEGVSFQTFSAGYMTVLAGCDPPSGAEAPVADACGVGDGDEGSIAPVAAQSCDADAEPATGDGGSEGGDDDAGTTTEIEEPDEPDADESPLAGDASCACTTARGRAAAPPLLVLSLLAGLRRRARRGRRRLATPVSLVVLGIGCACASAREDGRGGGVGLHGAESGEASGEADEAATADDGDPVLDVGTQGGTPGAACDPDSASLGGEVELSYIWIANSPEGTVSKIDTRTRTELGRYYTGPSMGEDDPSRTSVNLRGDVAVSNRRGGIVKLASEVERCEDRNGNGTIETSSGPDDVLAWDDEECRVWYREIQVDPGLPTFGSVNSQGPRPTAWDIGEHLDPCADDHRVWVGWYSAASQVMHLLRLDGRSGEILDALEEPAWPSRLVPGYGPYGGAVDPENALWVLGLGGPLSRVDPITLEVERWDTPDGTQPYGIAIDQDGHPWLAGLAGNVVHFDPDAATFDVIHATTAGLRGLQIDREGIAWAAHGVPGGDLGCGLVKVDVATRTLVDAAIPLPGCVEPVGVSIDADGFVWLPDKGADGAYKVDPHTHATELVGGLSSPYTYSDMTGSGLALVALPPAG